MHLPNVRRRLRWLSILVFAMSALFILTSGSPAAAAVPGIGDCKEPPTPQVPGRGISGWFGRPNVIPPGEDPFAPGAKTTVYEQYDLAGMRWWTYDLGCIGNSTDIGASTDTSLGNMLMLPTKVLVSLTSAVIDAAFHPTFMGVFDRLIDDVTRALTTGVMQVWLPLTITFVGLLILWKAPRQEVSVAMQAAGWALIVIVAAAVLVQYPTQAGHAADQVIVTTAGSIDGAINQRDGAGSGKAGQTLYEATLYRTWLAGVFGTPDSPVAKKYGPEILNATALTWDEARILEADPAEGQRIVDSKQKKFKDTAEKVKAEDPDAYVALQGRSDQRIGLGFMGLVAALVTVPFLLAAGLVMIGAFLVIRFAVMLFPVIATVGVIRPLSGVVLSVANIVAAALLNSVLFAAGAAIAIKILGFTLLGSGLPSWLAMLLAGLMSFILWRLLKPFRSLTQLVSPNRNPSTPEPVNPDGKLRRAGRFVAPYLGSRLGAKKGVQEGRGQNDGDEHDAAAPYTPYAPATRYEASRPPRAIPAAAQATPRAALPASGSPARVPATVGAGYGGSFAQTVHDSGEHTRQETQRERMTNVYDPLGQPVQATSSPVLHNANAVRGEDGGLVYQVFDPGTGRHGTVPAGKPGGRFTPHPRRDRPPTWTVDSAGYATRAEATRERPITALPVVTPPPFEPPDDGPRVHIPPPRL